MRSKRRYNEHDGTPRDTCWRRRVVESARAFHGWLVDRGSLTERLRRRCPAFRVEVVFAGLGRRTREERFLGAGEGAFLYVREVLLCCSGDPVVFARSVTRPRALKGAWRRLVRLGARPLGAVLFADPRVLRRPLRFRKLVPGSELHERASAAVGRRLPPLWARRSLFVSGGIALLVTEVFLPGVLRLRESGHRLRPPGARAQLPQGDRPIELTRE